MYRSASSTQMLPTFSWLISPPTTLLLWNGVLACPEPDVLEHLGHHRNWYWCCNLKLHHYPSHIRGYRQNSCFPILWGASNCCDCLCAPCVIQLPPDFLCGSASPHPANDEKRHRPYRLFWKLLSDVELWQDEEYLQRREGQLCMTKGT